MTVHLPGDPVVPLPRHADDAVPVPQGTLLVHSSPGDVCAVRVLADQPGSGLVLTGSDGLRAAADLRREGFSAPLLHDAERYKGNKGRRMAGSPFTQGLLDQQRSICGVALTDSGYVDIADHVGLAAILGRAAHCRPPVIATLPLHLSWLTEPVGVDRLINEMQEHRVPVALVLEDEADPLGRRGTVEGLLRVLGSGVPVLLLRSDAAAVGALAHGAWAAALGLRSGQRHLYPRRAASRYVPPGAPSVLIEQFLAFRRADALTTAVKLDPDDPMWTCGCGTCRGRRLDWLADVPGDEGHHRAAGHSVEVALRLRDHVLCHGRQRAAASWWALCDQALCRFDELGADLQWKTPPALRAWVRAGRRGLSDQIPDSRPSWMRTF
jgi:hypothetical protein